MTYKINLKLYHLERKMFLLKKDESHILKRLKAHNIGMREDNQPKSIVKKTKNIYTGYILNKDLKQNMAEQKSTEAEITKISAHRNFVVKESGVEKFMRFVEFANESHRALQFAQAIASVSPDGQYIEELKKALDSNISIESAVEFPALDRIKKATGNAEKKKKEVKSLTQKYDKDLRKITYRTKDVKKAIRTADRNLLESFGIKQQDDPKLNHKQNDQQRKDLVKRELNRRYGNDVNDQLEKARKNAVESERQRQNQLQKQRDEHHRDFRSR